MQCEGSFDQRNSAIGRIGRRTGRILHRRVRLDFTCSFIVTDSLCRERREHRVFGVLLQMIPGLESRLMNGDEDEVIHIADLVSTIVASTLVLVTDLALPAAERCFERSI